MRRGFVYLMGICRKKTSQPEILPKQTGPALTGLDMNCWMNPQNNWLRKKTIRLWLYGLLSFVCFNPAFACDIHGLLDANSYSEATSCVLAGEAEVNARNGANKAPLNRFLWFGRGASVLNQTTIPLIEALIDAGADLNSRPKGQEASAFEALLEMGMEGKARPLIRRMLLRDQNPADPNASVSMRRTPPHDERRLSPLLWAIKTGDLATAQFLLSHGVALDHVPAPEMGSPLLHALHYQQTEIARLLLDKGAMKSEKNHAAWLLDALVGQGGKTPVTAEAFALLLPYLDIKTEPTPRYLESLIVGAANWHRSQGTDLPAFRAAFKQFLAMGTNPNAVVGKHKNSLLQLLVSLGFGDLEVEEALLMQGANPNMADADGDTPLHQIALDRVRLRTLLAALPKSNIDGEELNLNDFMSEPGIRALANRLAGQPVRLEKLKTQYSKQMFSAALKRLDAFEKLLLKKGGNPKLKNLEGLTPGAIERGTP